MGQETLRNKRSLREYLRRNFITGLLVIVPLWLTWFVLSSIVKRIDLVLSVLPKSYHPDAWLPMPIPGLGFILTMFVILLVGMLGTNLLGSSFVRSFEALLGRIPLVRGIYGSSQQLLRQLVSVDSERFRRVVLVRYPGGEGIHRLGFVTGERRIIRTDGTHEKMLHIFLPNSPNAATGLFFMVAEDNVLPIDISTEEAFKLLMSGGLVEHDNHRPPSKRENT